jgi:hypothetical protein
MSLDIKIFGNANIVMERVRELRTAKLVQGIDFDFAYHQASWDVNDPNTGVTPKNAVFTFYTDKYATFYALKWA